MTEYAKQDLLLRERFKELGLPGNGMMTLERMREGLVLVSMKGLQCSLLCQPDSHLSGSLSALEDQKRKQAE